MRRSDHSALGTAVLVASTALAVLSGDARADEPSSADASERSSRVRLTAWSWIGGDGRTITSPNDEPKALVTYYETRAARFIDCPSEFEATDEARADCFAEQGPGALAGFRETLAESSDETIIISLGRWLGNPGRWNERHVAMIRLYDSVVSAEGFDEALAAVEAGRGSLDEESFFGFVRMIGVGLTRGYDEARTDRDRPESEGIVSPDRLLATIQHNLSVGSPTSLLRSRSLAPELAEYAGVCRDIAVFMTAVLRAGGYEHSYAMTYATDRVGHVIAIASDDAGRIRSLNYGSMGVAIDRDGSRALYQGAGHGMRDREAVAYHLFDDRGRPVASVTSALGAFLGAAAGTDPRLRDPLHRTNDSIAFVETRVDAGGIVRVASGAGVDAVGTQVGFVRSSLVHGTNSRTPGRVSVVGAFTRRPGVVLGTPGLGDEAWHVFAQIEQHLRSPTYQLARHSTLRFDTSFLATGAVGYSEYQQVERVRSVGGAFHHRNEVRLALGDAETTGELGLRVGTQLDWSQADVRDLGTPRLYLQYSYSELTTRLRRASTSIVASGTFVHGRLGMRVEAVGGIERPRATVLASYSGRVGDRSTLLENGSLRKLGLEVGVRPDPRIRILGRVRYGLEEPAAPFEGGLVLEIGSGA